MVVQHNLTAMNSNRMLGLTTAAQAKSTEKLSSGYKINRAADDAAGLSISEKMRKQIRGLTQASANAQDGISAVQTAEGALTEVHDMLQRMNELAVKASNGTMSENDRSYVQNEIDQLVTEIDRVSETTKFNETYLLKGNGKAVDYTEISGVINKKVVEGKTVKAQGNIYSGTIDTTKALAAGTEDTAVVEYKDADGNTRTKEVTFKVGADAKATAANIAEAINDDAELSRVFTASSDKDGKLSVESKLDGSKTDDTRNAVAGITFKSATPPAGGTAATYMTALTGTGSTAATKASYELTVGSGEDTVAKATALFATGSSVTIDGKTYTFDSGKTTSTEDANSFKTLQDLQDLLGSDYKVEMTVTATAADSTAKNPAPDVKLEQTIDAKTGAATAINALDETQFFQIDDGNPSTTGTAYELKAGSVTAALKITKLADTDINVDPLTLSLHVGADSTEDNKISVEIESMSARGLGIDGLRVDGETSANADNAIDTIADAIQKVSTQRSALGAVQNRLEHTINNLDNVVENTTSAESAIRDTDMATEMVKYSNNNILAQAGQAMLAQANQSNQGVLSLLG